MIVEALSQALLLLFCILDHLFHSENSHLRKYMIVLVLLASIGCTLAAPRDVQVQVTVEDIYEENANVNPEELSGFFEEDIELLLGDSPSQRNAVRDPARLWPGGVVPYVIGSGYTETEKGKIRQYMQEMMDLTMVNGMQCITFQPVNGEAVYLRFKDGNGCAANSIGYQDRVIAVTLGKNCRGRAPVMHEILHVLGFWHEHTRYDRDTYVKINWSNIAKPRRRNFWKRTSAEMDTLGQPYDYDSVMHYGAYALATDRSIKTITTIPDDVFIGQRRGLSTIDIRKVQVLYSCDVDTLVPGSAITSITASPTASPTPTPYSNTASEVCTFELDMCQWTQPADDTLNWHRHNGGTPFSHTGPHSDHTGSETGYYIFISPSAINAHRHHKNTAAILESGEYPGKDYCVDFYYHMNRPGVASFSLNVVADGAVTLLKKWRHSHGNHWNHQLLNAHVQTSGTFKFQFEGHTGNGNHGDIALDDIAIYLGDC